MLGLKIRLEFHAQEKTIWTELVAGSMKTDSLDAWKVEAEKKTTNDFISFHIVVIRRRRCRRCRRRLFAAYVFKFGVCVLQLSRYS